MNNRFFITTVIVFGTVLVAIGADPVAAQQTTAGLSSSQTRPLPLADTGSDAFSVTGSGYVHGRISFDKGGVLSNVVTMGGDVQITSGGHAVPLMIGPDEIVVTSPGGLAHSGGSNRLSQVGPMTVHILMKQVTTRVSVTPTRTVYQDQQGDKLTVITAAPKVNSDAGRSYMTVASFYHPLTPVSCLSRWRGRPFDAVDDATTAMCSWTSRMWKPTKSAHGLRASSPRTVCRAHRKLPNEAAVA